MKIAIVHPRLDMKGGAENVALWLAEGLLRRKHKVTIFTKSFRRELWQDFPEGCSAIKLLGGSFSFSKAIERIMLGQKLKRLLAGYDVVVADLFPSYVWVACAGGSDGLDAKTVWLCHEPYRRLYREQTDPHVFHYERYTDGKSYWDRHIAVEAEKCRVSIKNRKAERSRRWDREAVSRMNEILAISRFTGDNIRSIFGIEPKVCYLGVPSVEVFAAARATHSEEQYILTIGYCSPKKNLLAILEAMRKLVHEKGYRHLSLKVTGHSEVEEAYGEHVSRLGLKGNVEFTGFISDGELAALYRGALATIYVPIDEPFGLVALESMLHGTPVVISDHGGMSEVVNEGEMGFLVNPFAPEAIADAVARLLDIPERAREMGEKGRRRVLENFTMEKFIDRFEALALWGRPSDHSSGGTGEGGGESVRL